LRPDCNWSVHYRISIRACCSLRNDFVLLGVGSIFLFFVGTKVFSSKLELESIEESGNKINSSIEENKGGLRAGLIINLTNPSLFFGVLTSSFIVLSFASSVGLNTGGLEMLVQENVVSIQELTGETFERIDSTFIDTPKPTQNVESSSYSLLLSLVYAASLGTGGFLWLYILAKLLIKYRTKIKLLCMQVIIRGLSFVLFGISLYLLWTSINMLIVQFS
jgi:hypothetical protein